MAAGASGADHIGVAQRLNTSLTLSPLDVAAAGPAVSERLAVASRLSAKLAPLLEESEIARLAVEELHHSFSYYLAVIQHLRDDGCLHVIGAAGPLAGAGFLLREQPVSQGVNGRVARTGAAALVPDTRFDPDYLRRDARTDPGSELSLPIHVGGRVWGVMNLEERATNAFSRDDVPLAETVVAQVGAALHRQQLFSELERAFSTTLGALRGALEMKDSYTADHAGEVTALCERVGDELGLDPDSLRHLRYAALLHDIGKIGIRSEILTKPGRLTESEFDEMKQHTVLGAGMLRQIPFFSEVHPLVRSAHERWDGRGYPDGLAGEAIPLGARVVCACDAFHAMTSDRPYRAAMALDAARAELQRCAGTQFDPRVVEALLATLGS
jgi:putative nucleotidyltransferase with HDIG domain